MLQHLGVENSRQAVLLIAVVLLVAISPLGNEATHPLVFFSCRTLLFTIILLCALEIHRRGAIEVSSRFVLAGAALLPLMWISFQAKPGSTFDGRYAWHQVALFGIAFVALAVVNRNQPARWKKIILISIVATNLIYVLAALASDKSPASGPFVNPNYFASFLLAGFAVCVASAIFSSNLGLRIASVTGAGILFFGMTQAVSRGAVLSAVVLGGFGLLRGSRKTQLIMGAAGGILMLAFILGNVGLIRKFFDRGQTDPYNYARVQVWMSTLKMIGEHPLSGVGLGQFDTVSVRYSPATEGTIGRYLKRMGIAHSEYLQYIAELGLPAATLLFGLAGYLFLLALRRARHCVTSETRVFQEAAILSAVGLGTHALVDNSWRLPVMAAGLVAFSVGDVLPVRAWNLRIGMSKAKVAFVTMLAILLYVQSTVAPSLGLAFNEAGHRAFEAGDIDRAESLHALAAGVLPDAPVLLDNLGMVYFDRYFRSGNKQFLDDAEMFYRRAIAADPNDSGPKRHLEASLVQRLTGDTVRDGPVHRQIIEIDRAILEVDPYNPFVRGNLAEALYNIGDRDLAKAEMGKALEFEPNYVAAHFRLAEWNKASGNLAASESHRDQALSITAKYRNVKETSQYEALLLGRPSRPHEAVE